MHIHATTNPCSAYLTFNESPSATEEGSIGLGLTYVGGTVLFSIPHSPFLLPPRTPLHYHPPTHTE